MKRLIATLGLMLCAASAFAQETITVPFAQRDTCTLYMDIHRAECAAPGAPTILYVFGGGFKNGNRADGIGKWVSLMNEAGYNVVSIDYRLGLKNVDSGLFRFVDQLDRAIHLAVEDLFSATAFLLENGAQYGIDGKNIVVAGSSAGAITALHAEYEICNGTDLAECLPEDFNYTGVMAFSGAILSRKCQALRFPAKPCPILLLHGTEDKLVPYKKLALFGISFRGSSEIAKTLKRNSIPSTILRFADRGHEVSIYTAYSIPDELEFIEEYVIGNATAVKDIQLDDPSAPYHEWGRMNPFALYKK